MDKLSAMQTFVEIVDRGSLTAAAESLERSPPAVVRTLSALESSLGVRLLNRTTRRMSLTPDGALYVERCRQILADVDDAEAAMGDDDAEPHGHVKITAAAQFGALHVTPVISRLLAEYPRLSAELVLLDRNIDLVEEGIDLAIRIGELPDSGLIALPVGELSRVVCASTQLLERVTEPATPSDLEALPCIRLRNLPRPGTWTFHDKGKPTSIHINGPLTCNDISAALHACEAGVGFGQFLSYQVGESLRSGRLRRVLTDFEKTHIPVNIVYPGGRFIASRLQSLARRLQIDLRERIASYER